MTGYVIRLFQMGKLEGVAYVYYVEKNFCSQLGFHIQTVIL